MDEWAIAPYVVGQGGMGPPRIAHLRRRVRLLELLLFLAVLLTGITGAAADARTSVAPGTAIGAASATEMVAGQKPTAAAIPPIGALHRCDGRRSAQPLQRVAAGLLAYLLPARCERRLE